VLLLLGHNSGAIYLSTIAFFVFQDVKRISHCKVLEKWLLLSCLTIAASFLSILLLHISHSGGGWWNNYRRASDRLWFFGTVMPKLWGVALGSYIYQHFGSLHFLQINVRILQERNLVLATTKEDAIHRSLVRPYYVSLRHGPTSHVGKTSSIANTRNNPVWNELNEFRVPLLSPSIQIHKHMECHILDHDTEEPLGMVQVPIPTLRNLRVVHWYPVESSSSSGATPPTTTTGNGSKDAMGASLMVEIEVRSQLTTLNS
jgi:hypothetical protein